MSDYVFVEVDKDSIISDLISAYESITGVTLHPASPDKLFILWVADVIIQVIEKINYAANQNVPSRADGDNLDNLAELFYSKERPQASPARCTCRFNISAAQETSILVPRGTRVTDSSSTLIWETLDDVYVDIGDTYVDALIACQSLGVVGNGYAVGQINTLVDLYYYCTTCSNTTESEGGTDAATDAEFFELLRSSEDGYSCAGSIGGYKYFAKQVSASIADVVVNSPEAGSVNIYAIVNDGTVIEPAGETMKAAIIDACSKDEVRPLTDFVSVNDPENVDYNIDVTYYLSRSVSQSATETEEKVAAAVSEYVKWQSSKMGRDINPSVLVSLMMETGIKRVVVTSPSFTSLDDGSENNTPQYANIGTQVVTNGGYEDE